MISPTKLKRVERQFYITIRTHSYIADSEAGCTECSDDASMSIEKEPKIKFTNRVKSAISSLADDLTSLVKQKTGHWALVVEAYPNDKSGASKRVFEICKNPDDGTSDASQSDRYASDEEYPIGSTSVILGVKAGTEERKNYSEPDFAKLGGVCWTLLESLKSETRFTNSEIKHEARRIWKRQRNYRVLDNNCQRFAILLAIYIRARQNTLLRLLTGKIVKKQAGYVEKIFGGLTELVQAGLGK